MAEEIKGTKISEMTEIVNADNEGYLLILTNGENKKIKAKYLKGADNLTEQYIDLKADNGQIYRMTLNNDGSQTIFPIEAYTGADASVPSSQYYGLIINQIYGGGNAEGTPVVSHSFIELYNDTGLDINLKGMYLFYKTKGAWQSLALKGVIPYQHSFLIRGASCHDSSFSTSDLIRCKIDKYDQEWNIPFSDKGFVAFLAVGDETPTEDDLIKTKTNSLTGETITSKRFIDIMAGHGTGAEGITVDHFDSKTARKALNRSTSLRKIDFGFCSSSERQYDCLSSVEAIDYNTCDVSIYRPRCLADGKWDYYVNRLKLNQNIPNLVNICYGADGETTRTFTWQSKVTDEGYLKYRRIKDDTDSEVNESWKKIETTKEMVKHHDQDCTIHRVIIKDLEPGIYEYQCGEEGSWSDIETFEVKKYLKTSGEVTTYEPMKILWTSDQQG